MKKYKVILKCGKVWSSLFDSVSRAIKELGASNIGGIQEVMLIDLK